MKMVKLNRGHKSNPGPDNGVMIEVDKQEAAQLIQSLAEQLATGSSNVGRLESYTVDGEYVSIAVNFKD